MSDWQPIETAPKDCEILIARHNRISIAKWDDDRHAKRPKPYWNDHSFNGVTFMRNIQPDYWHPLPPPPTL
jgi:hypothetical protein